MKDVSKDGGVELSYTRSWELETAYRFRCVRTQTHMRQLLSIDNHYQIEITLREGAPMSSRANWGTDSEEVSIGRVKWFNIA